MGSLCRLPFVMLAAGCFIFIACSFLRGPDSKPLPRTVPEAASQLAPQRRQEVAVRSKGGTRKQGADIVVHGFEGEVHPSRNATKAHEDSTSAETGLKSLKRASNKGRRSCRPDQLVYVYDLPPHFNVGLTRDPSPWITEHFCAAHPRNACVVYSAAHGGIGPPLEDKRFSVLGSKTGLWADTGQHALEVMFHHYLENLYPCRTRDPEAAAAFYVPLYPGLLWLFYTHTECFPHQCSEPPPFVRLEGELEHALGRLPYLERNKGRDHFVTMAFSTYLGIFNSSCCDSGLLNAPFTKEMTILGTQPAYGHVDRQVNIPYPTSLHPVSLSDLASHQALIITADRPVFASFAGSLDRKGGLNAGRELRAALKAQCEPRPELCMVLACGKVCSTALSFELYLRSTFCLQPPGDSPTRRGVFDSLQAGCIPVLFSPETVNPYANFLPANMDRYAVFIPMDDVTRGGKNVIEVLKNVSDAEIAAKRKFMAGLLPRLVYRNVKRTLEKERGLGEGQYRGKLLGWTGAYEVAIGAALQKTRERTKTSE